MDPKPNSNLGSAPTEEEAFYNVMPQEVSGPRVSSQADIPAQPADASVLPNDFTLPHSRRKLFMGIIIVLVLAILGTFGYFGYRYAQQYKTVEPPVNLNTEQPTNTEPEPPVNATVTTPADWQKRYFSTEECVDNNVCGDAADPDRDGLTNLEEYNTKTDPNNADSDADGLADGDEVHVFGGSPLTQRTNSSEDYIDADFAKGGYDITTNVKYSDTQLAEIKTKIKDRGLHQPTIKTLGADSLKQYDFTDPTGGVDDTDSSVLDPSIDQSPTAKLARDTQRSNTIQKIGAALLKYKTAKGVFPETADFTEMTNLVKPYITVATNYSDPINKGKYVYGYVPGADNKEFTLLYFSETQNLVIKYTDQQAELDLVKNNASAFDDERLHDVENIARALGIYSDAHTDVNSTQTRVFPTEATYKDELVQQQFISEIPKDPRTGADYSYEVGEHFDTFVLKAVFDNPARGQTGFLCNQEECHYY
jgi:hypothetical protein